MKYVIARTIKTKARDAVDGKEHRRSVYFAGIDTLAGFGIETWGKKAVAKRFDDERTAERYARALGGRVVEIR